MKRPDTTTAGSRRRQGPSIFVKQVVVYLLLILLLVGVTSQLFFSTARRHLEDEVGRKLEYVARIAAGHAPVERLELIRAGDEESRMVLRLEQKLGEIRDATSVQNTYVFRADMTSLLDLMPGVRIGTVYQLPQFSAAHLASLGAGQSVHTDGYQVGTGQMQMSAYAPIQDQEGHLYAIVGVDAGTKELDIVEQMRVRLLWIALGCAGAGFLAALLFARSITAPIRHIVRTAEQLGSGDYSARASVRTRDELGRLAEAVNQMAAQIRDRDTALKEMAASVAHEIRNPLNSIKLLVSLLDDEGSPREKQSTVDTLHYEISKLNRFITEFLTYSRPMTLIKDRVSVDGLIENVVDMASVEAGERGICLTTEVAEGVQDLSADRQRLEQSLLNIVLNAVQASPPGGRLWSARSGRRVKAGKASM